MEKLLVVAAWEPELAYFRELAAKAAELVFEAIGVGLVEAAAGTTRALLRHRPSHALMIGTCGSLAKDLAVLDVVAGASASLVAEELPAPMPKSGAFDAAMTGWFGVRAVAIANTIGITTDDDTARSLRARFEVEHLEAFAFLRASMKEDVPCATVLAIANAVGARGREEWLTNHEAASKKAAEIAYAGIRSSTRARSPA